MSQKNSYNKDDLLSMANGDMFGQSNAKLPQDPMLMIDRILSIKNTVELMIKVQLSLKWI